MVEEVEKILTVPLNISRSIPRTKRAKRAITEIKEFVAKHMKAGDGLTDEEKEEFVSPLDKVWIDSKLNEKIWSRGIQKPPAKIRVRAIRFEDGLIEVSLPEE